MRPWMNEKMVVKVRSGQASQKGWLGCLMAAGTGKVEGTSASPLSQNPQVHGNHSTSRLLPSCLQDCRMECYSGIWFELLVVDKVTNHDHIITSLLLPHFNPSNNLYDGWHKTFTNKGLISCHTWSFLANCWLHCLQTPLKDYYHFYYLSKPTYEHPQDFGSFSLFWLINRWLSKYSRMVSLLCCLKIRTECILTLKTQ